MGTQLPFGFAKRHQVLLQSQHSQLTLSYSPSASLHALAEGQRFAGGSVTLAPVDQETFNQLLAQYYSNRTSSAETLASDLGGDINLASLVDALPQTTDLMEQEDDAPVIRLINAMLSEAIKENASDIHLETFEHYMSIRFRVDGVLREILNPSRALSSMLISRLKVMAKLDIAEKRLPQDGRISLKLAGREIDVRVSTLPSNDSERVVLRLLEKQLKRLNFLALGMQEIDVARINKLLHRPHGILLVTGPTGSGKTTTLYAGLQSIQSGSINILTIEDPVEYNLEGIGQTQVNTKAGMSFAKGLRAILRQDPDVVMVGEIRDIETAQIAIQASLTGHLVLSTLHTNTAIGAITRLDDMGIEPFLLSSSLIGVLAQRLVRVLCPHCKVAHNADDKERNLLKLNASASDQNPISLYSPSGCHHCNHLGYLGRTGVYELVVVTDSLRKLIHDRASEVDLTAEARKNCTSLFDDGRRQVLTGVTSLEELMRVSQEN
ncbi:MAG: type II secretion system ATPase GspE [Porticoccaceae bacterium]|nr:type II secretion system ATPase GspE [Porticoccaceae bacterium]